MSDQIDAKRTLTSTAKPNSDDTVRSRYWGVIFEENLVMIIECKISVEVAIVDPKVETHVIKDIAAPWHNRGSDPGNRSLTGGYRRTRHQSC